MEVDAPLLSSILQAVGEPVAVLNCDHQVLACSESFRQQIRKGNGSPPADRPSLPHLLADAEPERRRLEELLDAVVRRSVPAEMSLSRLGLAMTLHVRPTADETGRIVGSVAVLRPGDSGLDAPSPAEQRDTDDLKRLAVQVAQMGTWVFDPQTGQTEWDERASELFGLPGSRKVSAEQVYSCIHPDDRRSAEQNVQAATAPHGEGLYSAEYRVIHPDGSVHWLVLRGHAQLAEDASPATARFVGVVLDRTEHQRDQMRLAERDALQGVVAENVPYGTWTCNARGECTYVTKSFLEMVGKTWEEVGRFGWMDLVNPDDAGPLKVAWQRCVATGEDWEFEYRIRSKAGPWVTLLTKGRALRDGAGEITGWVGIHLDVTERRADQQAVRDAAQQLRLALLAGRMGIWDWDPLSGSVHWSEGHFRIFGYDQPDGPATYEMWRSRVHPEDLEGLERAIARCMDSGHDYQAEYRVIWPDGSVHWIEGRGQCRCDKQGQVTRMFGVVINIDAQKQAEHDLRRSEQQFRGTFETAAVGIAHVGLDARWLRVNDKLCDITGYNREDLLAATFRDLTHADDLDADLQQFQRMIRGEITGYSLEKRYIRSDGEVIWINLTTSMQRDEAGEPLYAISIVEDVTLRRQAFEQLEALTVTLEQRVAERTAVVQRQADQLRELASQLTQAEQRERRRVAFALHDHLQQILAAGRMRLDRLAGRLEDEEERAFAGQISELMLEAIEASRSLAVELSPPVLQDAGLIAALQWLSEHLRDRHELVVHVHTADGAPEPASEDVRAFAFHATRELLMNVLRHAQTNEAWLRIEPAGDRSALRITVEDRGEGIDLPGPDQMPTSSGFGLYSIQQRVVLLGGRLAVVGKPGEGTQATLEVPA